MSWELEIELVWEEAPAFWEVQHPARDYSDKVKGVKHVVLIYSYLISFSNPTQLVAVAGTYFPQDSGVVAVDWEGV